jgi:hypothetical protein
MFNDSGDGKPLSIRVPRGLVPNGRVLSRLTMLPILAGLMVSTALPEHVDAGPADTVWTQLFNGTDFKDWDIKTMGLALNQDPKNTYRIVDSAIEVNYSNYTDWSGEPWSHIGYKVRPFSYYVVRLEYQFFGNQVGGAPGYANENSGIMLHSQSLASMALNQNWPISLEDQLLGPKSTQGPGSGNLCTPGTAVEYPKGQFNDNHCINAVANTKASAPAWVKASAIVLGDSMVVQLIENKPVLTYYRPMEQQGIVTGNTTRAIINRKPLGSGYILLQAESSPIRFRRIQLANLEGCMDKASPNYKSYYVKNDAADCKALPIHAAGDDAKRGLTFAAESKRLSVAGPGPHAVRITDVEGRLLWSHQGEGARSYGLGAIPYSGVCLITVSHARGTFTGKLYLEH